MYIVDTTNNKLVKATPCTFKSLGFEERKNLQEWIAKEPSCLGEELRIIQKEFDGFSDTKERLDLLAMDKKGNFVIIENKLDDRLTLVQHTLARLILVGVFLCVPLPCNSAKAPRTGISRQSLNCFGEPCKSSFALQSDN